MKFGTNTITKLIFVAVLLISTAIGVAWYLNSSSGYTTYQINTEDLVSGLIVDAPIEFHGVDV